MPTAANAPFTLQIKKGGDTDLMWKTIDQIRAANRYEKKAKNKTTGKEEVSQVKPQGRGVLQEVLKAVLEVASPETLAALADDVAASGKNLKKLDDVKKNQALIAYIKSVPEARQAAARGGIKFADLKKAWQHLTEAEREELAALQG